MAFWKSANAAPVQSHHFQVVWGRGDDKVESHTVKSVTKPSVEVNEGEYQVGNQKFKYPGVARWNDVTITLVDDKETTRRLINKFIAMGWLNPNHSDLYGFRNTPPAEGPNKQPNNWLFKPYHSNLAQRTDDGLQKTAGVYGMGDVRIIQHATLSERTVVKGREPTFWRPGTPDTFRMHAINADLEKWTLKGSWIKSINFGQLDYSSDELITIEVVIAYDYCEIEWGYSFGLT